VVSASVLTDALVGGDNTASFSTIYTNAASLIHLTSSVSWVYEQVLDAVFVGPGGASISASVNSVSTNGTNGQIRLSSGYTIDAGYTGQQLIFTLATARYPEDDWDKFSSSSLQDVCQSNTTYVNRTNGYWQYSPTASQAVNARTTTQAFVVKRFFSTAGSASRNEAFSSSLMVDL